MKRKLEQNGESDSPPQKHMYGPMQHYGGGWQPRGQGNMRGGATGVNSGVGGVGSGNVQAGYRGGRGGGPWRGPPRYMTPDHNRGYLRGRRGRGGPQRYPYDNSQQPYMVQQQNQWHQQQYAHDPMHQHSENDNIDMDTTNQSGCTNATNCMQGNSGNMCNWNNRRTENNTKAGNTTAAGNVAGDANNMVGMEGSYTKTKVKRRPMSQNYSSKPWNREDAERALAVESAHMKGLRNQSLIIRFPDPELSKDMVKNFYPGIENVHFQVPSGPRYCFVQLAEDVNPDTAIKELSVIKFGNGNLQVEKKFNKDEEDLSPEAIDPYTLYIGNLPTNVNIATVKEKFPTASRVDVGFAMRMKFTRYAFIRYTSVDDAIQAYKKTHNLILDSRSIIVRFRRVRGPVGLPGECRQQKPPKSPNAQVMRESSLKTCPNRKTPKKETTKPKKEKGKTDASHTKSEKEKKKTRDRDDDDEDDDEEDDDDDDDDDDEEEDDDDDDDDEEEDDDDDDSDNEEEDEEEDDDDDEDDDVGPDAPDDDPESGEDDDEVDDGEDDDNEEDDEDNNLSQKLFQQMET